MNRFHMSLIAILLLTLLGTARVISTQTSEEAAGEAAEQSGKLREAVTHYVAALQVASEGSDGEQRLREKIISLVVKLDPPPALPDEAVRYEGRAEAAVKNARVPADFLDAANEYKKALRLAPWMSHYYYNLGLVLEKAERREESIRSLKLYLLAAPNAQDQIAVRKKVAGLEYEIEKEGKAREEAKERERQRREAERQEQQRRQVEQVRELEGLSGIWEAGGGGMRYRVTISGNNIEIAFYESFNWKTETWHSDHSCPWGWRGTISGLQISGVKFYYDSCESKYRPPQMSVRCTGRIIPDRKGIILNGLDWDYRERRWSEYEETLLRLD